MKPHHAASCRIMPHFWRITKRFNDKIHRGLAFFSC
jgi:hypothetical protein